MLFCLFLIFYKSTSSANIIFFFLLILAYCFAFSRLPLASFLNSATFQKMTAGVDSEVNAKQNSGKYLFQFLWFSSTYEAIIAFTLWLTLSVKLV